MLLGGWGFMTYHQRGLIWSHSSEEPLSNKIFLKYLKEVTWSISLFIPQLSCVKFAFLMGSVWLCLCTYMHCFHNLCTSAILMCPNIEVKCILMLSVSLNSVWSTNNLIHVTKLLLSLYCMITVLFCYFFQEEKGEIQII